MALAAERHHTGTRGARPGRRRGLRTLLLAAGMAFALALEPTPEGHRFPRSAWSMEPDTEPTPALSPSAPVSTDNQRISGRILSVALEDRRFLLDDLGRRWWIEVPLGVVLRRGAEARELSSLRKGDRVVVTLADGQSVPPPGQRPESSEPSLLRARLISLAGVPRLPIAKPTPE